MNLPPNLLVNWARAQLKPHDDQLNACGALLFTTGALSLYHCAMSDRFCPVYLLPIIALCAYLTLAPNVFSSAIRNLRKRAKTDPWSRDVLLTIEPVFSAREAFRRRTPYWTLGVIFALLPAVVEAGKLATLVLIWTFL